MPYIPNTSRTLSDLNYTGKSKMHSRISIKSTCKNMDLGEGVDWVLLGFWLVGLVWGGVLHGEGVFVVFLILFLKCAVHISAKSAAHINEAAWVL